MAHLLFAATSGQEADVIAAATAQDALRPWYAQAVPAVYPEHGLRVPRASGAGQGTG